MMQRKALKQYLIASLLLIAGTISWSITMIKSGVIYSFGMGFWGANGHDGIWHLALINSLSRDLIDKANVIAMPTFAGESIKNYHLGFDLILAFIHNLTQIPTVNLYFQIAPPIIALLIGITTYGFMYAWKKSSKIALWSTFFVYFGGEISWIFGHGESTFWSQQSISTLINPPFALSLVFIFSGLYFLLKKKPLFAILFFGVLLETKAYAGVLILGSLLIAGVWEFLFDNRFSIINIFLGSALISLVLFFALNRGSENLFIFSPFWFLSTLFNPDRFSIPRMTSAIGNYNLANDHIKLFFAYFAAFVVFWVGNMWTRLFKEIEVLKWLRRPKTISSMDVFVTSMIIGGALAPMLFIQKGTPWNTIQFFYYSLIFSAILAGVGIENIFKNRSQKFILVFSFAVVLLTIPTTIITLRDVYVPPRPPAKVSNEELSALEFLFKQDSGIVLTYPYDQDAANAAVNNPPRPLYLYDSTAYVSAFSNHQTFLEDQVNLDITNFSWQERRKEMFDNFLNTNDVKIARSFLQDNHIKYVYWLHGQRAKLNETQLGLINIFENSEVNVYSVNKN